MDDFNGKRLLILGLARQGKALARFAAEHGAAVTISDLRPSSTLTDSLNDLQDWDIEFVLGEHPMSLLEKADLLAISGGVPLDAPLVKEARARHIPLTNDSQEFIKRSPTAVIGITGSAGKTTTTALVGLMGQFSGRRTWVGGNIGRPLIADLDKMERSDIVVQELSSFQLEIWQQSPPVAAVLNITPNHLDRHKTMAAYINAKANILRRQSADDIAVLSADDAGAMALRPLAQGHIRYFSLTKPIIDGAFVHEDHIWLRNGKETAVCPASAVQLRGQHNLSNVLAAVTLADSAGIPIEAIRRGIREFSGVEHRLELVREHNGVRYINDSIATAPERTLAALNAFDEPIILLAGGRDKEMVWDAWAETVKSQARHVILFGDLADLLMEKLSQAGMKQLTRVDTLAEATAAAAGTAVSGDIVLLSPGGTSFDAFTDFAERGEKFRELVNAL